MKLKLWIIGVILALTAWGLLEVYTNRALCASRICAATPCFHSVACGPECVCAVPAGEVAGVCMGIK